MRTSTAADGRVPRTQGFGALVLVVVLALSATPGTAAAQPVDGLPRPPGDAATRPAAPALTADGAVLYSPDDGVVLFAGDATTARPMASTTKIMTALLALEAGTLDDVVTVSRQAAATGRLPGAATLQLDAGDRVAMGELLAALVARSGNDAAVAVAEHVAGTEAAFVERMNARADQLGLTATDFRDASGLSDDPGHVASPWDLARLGTTAMALPEFAAWAGAAAVTVPGVGVQTNRNELIGAYPGATGVKTGYTRRAGECLVASATRDGRTLVAVVLGSEDSSADAAALLDHGFDAWRRTVPASPAAPIATYRSAGGEALLEVDDPLDATIPATATATWRMVLDPVITTPTPAGTPVGRAKLLLDGAVVDTVALRSATRLPGVPSGARPAARVGGAVEDALRAFARTVPGERAA